MQSSQFYLLWRTILTHTSQHPSGRNVSKNSRLKIGDGPNISYLLLPARITFYYIGFD